MSHIYDDVIRTVSERIKTNREEMMVVIYNNADCVRDQDFRTETNKHQPLQRAVITYISLIKCHSLHVQSFNIIKTSVVFRK